MRDIPAEALLALLGDDGEVLHRERRQKNPG